MPDNHANKFRENLNRRSISPEKQVEKTLKDIARDIAILESDPGDWVDWVVFFHSHLTAELENRWVGHDSASLIEGFINRLQKRR